MSFLPGLSILTEKVPDLTTPRGALRAGLTLFGLFIIVLWILDTADSVWPFLALILQLIVYVVVRWLLSDFFNGRRDRMPYTDALFGRFLPAAGLNLATLLFVLTNDGGGVMVKGVTVTLIPGLLGKLAAVYLLITGALLIFRTVRAVGFDTLAGMYIYYPDEGRQVTDATYKLLRHPLYAGMDRFALGFAFWNGTTLALLYALIYVFIFHPTWYRLEETELVDRFGDSYREYRDRVPAVMPASLAGEVTLLEALTRPS